MHIYETFELAKIYITELKSNQTITKSIILGGHLEVDGICSGGGGVVIQILELGEM